MTKFEDNISPYLSFVEGAAPSSPAATNFKLYYDSADHLLKWKNSAGSVTTIATGAGSAGALVFLEAHTASASASLAFTTFYSSTYDDYLVEIVDLLIASNNVALRLEYSSDGGSTWDTSSNYYSGHSGVTNGGVGFTINNNPTTAFILGSGIANTATRPVHGSIRLRSLASTALDKMALGHIAYSNQANVGVGVWFGLLTVSGTAYNAFRVLASSGNLTSGVIRVYGITKS